MKVHDVDEMMQRMLFGTWLGSVCCLAHGLEAYAVWHMAWKRMLFGTWLGAKSGQWHNK